MNFDDLDPELRRKLIEALKKGGVDPSSATKLNVQDSEDSTNIKIGWGKYSVEVPRPSGATWDAVVLVATGGLIAIASALAQAQIGKSK
ncbi:hypothetical protein [Trinickia symbiotica]|uniref:hypothetical protein n=1 Tax=Trinickia symbiotica TaxID=863227 RepID=UPI000370BDF1|nr:hypothetical protein [Trinickia symbiotica]